MMRPSKLHDASWKACKTNQGERLHMRVASLLLARLQSGRRAGAVQLPWTYTCSWAGSVLPHTACTGFVFHCSFSVHLAPRGSWGMGDGSALPTDRGIRVLASVAKVVQWQMLIV